MTEQQEERVSHIVRERDRLRALVFAQYNTIGQLRAKNARLWNRLYRNSGSSQTVYVVVKGDIDGHHLDTVCIDRREAELAAHRAGVNFCVEPMELV